MAKSLNGDPVPTPDPDVLLRDRCVKFIRAQKEFTGITVIVHIKPSEEGDDVKLFGDPDLPQCAILACLSEALEVFDGEDSDESEVG